MNGIHDMGGMHGYGPIIAEENEPYFHHEWERQAFPLFASLYVGGHFNLDEWGCGCFPGLLCCDPKMLPVLHRTHCT